MSKEEENVKTDLTAGKPGWNRGHFQRKCQKMTAKGIFWKLRFGALP